MIMGDTCLEIGYRDFPKSEYELRYQRARQLMKEKKLDALLIADKINYRYFSGHISPAPNKPSVMILPIDHEPILVCTFIGSYDPKELTWITNTKIYHKFTPFNIQSVEEAIRELGLEKAKIGAELNDLWFRMNIPFTHFETLRKQVSTAQFVDASNLLWKVKMIKSAAEINCLKKACEITGRSYQRLFNSIEEGMTEKEVAGKHIQYMIEEGADPPSVGRAGPCSFISVYASRHGHDPGTPPIPMDKPLKKGDVLFIDSGSVYNGYCSDFSREGVIGGPTEEHRKAYQKLRDENLRAIEAVKPGIKLGELKIHWHGIGMKHVESPYPNIHNERMIEEGMTLAMERSIWTPNGLKFGHEDNLVVTKNGYEILSKVSSELYTI